jgi:AcrR family transcriptional regulator
MVNQLTLDVNTRELSIAIVDPRLTEEFRAQEALIVTNGSEPSGSLRELKRRRAALELAAAALDLFETNGYQQTTVADICRAAMQSPSTFFRLFGSKEEVLFADQPEHLEALTADISSRLQAGTPAWPAVTDSLIKLVRSFYADPDSVSRRIILWQKEPALRATWVHHSTTWEIAITELVAAHRHNEPHRDAYAQVVATSGIGAFRLAVAWQGNTDVGFLGRITEIFEVFGRGVSKP